MPKGHCDEREKQPYLIVCWRSMTIVMRGARVCTLTRDHTHTPQSHNGWWKEEDYKEPQEQVEAAARRAHMQTPL